MGPDEKQLSCEHRIKDLDLQGGAADGAIGKLEDNSGHC
jgi:hypothetical protein